MTFYEPLANWRQKELAVFTTVNFIDCLICHRKRAKTGSKQLPKTLIDVHKSMKLDDVVPAYHQRRSSVSLPARNSLTHLFRWLRGYYTSVPGYQ